MPCLHTKGVLAKILMDCVSQYSLANKISSVVVDNCTTNYATMRVLLDEFEPRSLILGGALLHMRCGARILNLIVQDGLGVIDLAIEKICECVSFWMLIPQGIENFEEACRVVEVFASKMLILDCKTRWNSTFLMLQMSITYKEVFTRLKSLNKKLKFVLPSEAGWKMAQNICEKLDIFYKATKAFSGRDYPTSHLFF